MAAMLAKAPAGRCETGMGDPIERDPPSTWSIAHGVKGFGCKSLVLIENVAEMGFWELWIWWFLWKTREHSGGDLGIGRPMTWLRVLRRPAGRAGSHFLNCLFPDIDSLPVCGGNRSSKGSGLIVRTRHGNRP